MIEKRKFPYLTIVKASAGSGKTYFLTKTYVEFLLSDSIRYNDLKNILAITFSNNAAIEIKEKIIDWLKALYFGKDDALKEFENLGLSVEKVKQKSEHIINSILNNYSEFQVRTIDSFLTKIFKAEALKFGYPGDFDILMNNENFLQRAFEIFLGRFNEKSESNYSVMQLIEVIEDTLLSDSSYLWNPSKKIFKELKNLYRIISKSIDRLDENTIQKIKHYLNEFEKAKNNLKNVATRFYNETQKSGSIFYKKIKLPQILESVMNEHYNKIFDATFNKIPISNPTDEIKILWEELKKSATLYVNYYSKTYFIPYILVFLSFEEILRNLKIKEQKVFIEDVNQLIREKIAYLSIPEIYIKLGERIYHYFIDEFQDTSPVQWENLKILIENSLSEGGSLLLVGDTKQAIYGFRGADYSIMVNLIREAEKPKQIPSVEKYKIQNLSQNYRSGKKILDFVKEFFKKELKEYLQKESKEKEIFCKEDTPLPLSLSGLYDCEQDVREDLKDVGFVRIERIEYEEEIDEIQKESFINLIEKLKTEHGFSNRNIAVLAFKNDTINQLSTWLNEKGIDFISYSSLDIRNRKIISELIFLLKFLHSPLDNFSFSTFLLGEIANINFKNFHETWLIDLEKFLFSCNIYKHKNFDEKPYYIKFREQFPQIWEAFFEELLKKVGFLPLYDLVSEIYNRFRLFEVFPEEQGALIKFLEILLSFEGNGGGLKNFIEFYETSGDEDLSFWDTSKPFGKDAITLMTVHKAKGLEFPAVVLWADMDSIKLEKIIFYNGEFLKLPAKTALDNTYSKDLKEIREESLNRNYAEEFNKLYVALTRAKDTLYIAIPCKKTEKPDSEPCPKKNDAVKCLFKIDTPDEKYVAKIKDEKNEYKDSSFEIKHFISDRALLSKDYSYRYEATNTKEIKRGDFLHKIISTIIYFDYDNEKTLIETIKEKIEKLNFELKTLFDAERILEIIIDILKNQKLKQYFVPLEGREVFTEKEIVDNDGNLYRVDRLVVDIDKITLLEFKFGATADEQKALEQISKYLELLGGIYPNKKLEGLIYFSQKNKLKRV